MKVEILFEMLEEKRDRLKIISRSNHHTKKHIKRENQNLDAWIKVKSYPVTYSKNQIKTSRIRLTENKKIANILIEDIKNLKQAISELWTK